MIDALLPELAELLARLDYAGVAVFAIGGALVGARARQDIVTCIFFAVLTGLGGGTLRDLLIGAPVFWIRRSGNLEICIAAAVVVFALRTDRWPHKLLNWLDAVGVSAFCVVGTLKSLEFGASPAAAAAMGVITAMAGGILRDVLAMRPSPLLAQELYITAALVGSALTVLGVGLQLSHWAVGIGAALVAFAIRAGAIVWGWKLPVKRD